MESGVMLLTPCRTAKTSWSSRGSNLRLSTNYSLRAPTPPTLLKLPKRGRSPRRLWSKLGTLTPWRILRSRMTHKSHRSHPRRIRLTNQRRSRRSRRLRKRLRRQQRRKTRKNLSLPRRPHQKSRTKRPSRRKLIRNRNNLRKNSSKNLSS